MIGKKVIDIYIWIHIYITFRKLTVPKPTLAQLEEKGDRNFTVTKKKFNGFKKHERSGPNAKLIPLPLEYKERLLITNNEQVKIF